MALSRQSIENLLDLVEIKISAMQIQDREDARELKSLEACRDELMGMQAALRAARSRHVQIADNVIQLAH